MNNLYSVLFSPASLTPFVNECLVCSSGWICFNMTSIGLMSNLRYFKANLTTVKWHLSLQLCMGASSPDSVLSGTWDGDNHYLEFIGGIKSLESRGMKLIFSTLILRVIIPFLSKVLSFRKLS